MKRSKKEPRTITRTLPYSGPVQQKCSLRKLVATQQTAAKNRPPPTAITSMLESILDGKDPSSRQKQGRMKKASAKKVGNSARRKDVKNSLVPVDKKNKNNDLWSGVKTAVTLGPEEGDENKFGNGATNLDDLLESGKLKSSEKKVIQRRPRTNDTAHISLSHESVKRRGKKISHHVNLGVNKTGTAQKMGINSEKNVELSKPQPKNTLHRPSMDLNQKKVESIIKPSITLNLPGVVKKRTSSILGTKRKRSISSHDGQKLKLMNIPNTDTTDMDLELENGNETLHSKNNNTDNIQGTRQFASQSNKINTEINKRKHELTSLATKELTPQSSHYEEIKLKPPMELTEDNRITPKTKEPQQRKISKKIVNNDNFVRLNLKNSAGACRGARDSLRKHNRQKRWRAAHKNYNVAEQEEQDGGTSGNRDKDGISRSNSMKQQSANMPKSIDGAIDPMDDYMDGAFHQHDKPKKSAVAANDKRPYCARHQRPCKLLEVKKTGTGNKGRKFYVCSMPRGEQCNHFQWEDDTIGAAQKALMQSSSHSGFVARQVAAYNDRFKALTLPELRLETKKRKLHSTGKKGALLARLSVWVRDEISQFVAPDEQGEEKTIEKAEEIDQVCSSDDENPSEDELEICCQPSGSDVKNGKEEEGLGDEPVGADIDSSHESELEVDDEYSSEEELEICEESELKAENSIGESDNCEPQSSLHSSLRELFGYSTFRPGQEWAIRRSLSHRRTLFVAPTGMGKSLCYALPAALMEGICIVVSPLISLMEDQLRQLPPKIPAATLSGNLSRAQLSVIIDDIIRKRLKILFVSPERLASSAFRRLLRPRYNKDTSSYERQLPTVSLLCVDEAHCLSQWGHSFRPSYLRLRSIMPLLDPKSVLALTATAGPPVVMDICHTLRIPLNGVSPGTQMINKESEPCSLSVSSKSIHNKDDLDGEVGVKVQNCNRDNIDVAVAYMNNEDERLQTLYQLLKAPKEATSKKSTNNPIRPGCLSSGSVIVYVWRQKDAEVITEQLRGIDVDGGVVCYHGGMDANTRAKTQGKFMRSKARVCVATVAFGLGINKADVSGIIHLCLPPSPEHYLQEIGRAGRDGRSAQAIALVLSTEVASKHSLSYSNKISYSQITALLSTIQNQVKEACNEEFEGINISNSSQIDIAVNIQSSIMGIDCKEESIQTIFSLLEDELPPFPQLLDIEGMIPDSATVILKRRTIEKLACDEPVMKCIEQCGIHVDARKPNENSPANHVSTYGGTATEKGFAAYSFGIYDFSVVKVSRLLGPNAEPRHVFAALRRLQSSGEVEVNFGISKGMSMHLKINENGIQFFNANKVPSNNNGDFDSAQDIHSLAKLLLKHFSNQDDNSVKKLLKMQQIMQKVSSLSSEDASDRNKDTDVTQPDNLTGKSTRLIVFQDMIHQYFESGTHDEIESDETQKYITNIDKDDQRTMILLSSDVDSLLQLSSLSKGCTASSFAVQFGDEDFSDYTSLTITKILHGITAPRTPVLDWFRHPLWGKWKNINFISLLETISQILSTKII